VEAVAAPIERSALLLTEVVLCRAIGLLAEGRNSEAFDPLRQFFEQTGPAFFTSSVAMPLAS
jgi:hypothetical protein